MSCAVSLTRISTIVLVIFHLLNTGTCDPVPLHPGFKKDVESNSKLISNILPVSTSGESLHDELDKLDFERVSETNVVPENDSVDTSNNTSSKFQHDDEDFKLNSKNSTLITVSKDSNELDGENHSFNDENSTFNNEGSTLNNEDSTPNDKDSKVKANDKDTKTLIDDNNPILDLIGKSHKHRKVGKPSHKNRHNKKLHGKKTLEQRGRHHRRRKHHRKVIPTTPAPSSSASSSSSSPSSSSASSSSSSPSTSSSSSPSSSTIEQPSILPAATACAGAGQIPCPGTPGKCIFESWLCDFVLDCPEGTDEMGCNMVDKGISNEYYWQQDPDVFPPIPVDCGAHSGDLMCGLSTCIPRDRVCDHVIDCIDGKDETLKACLKKSVHVLNENVANFLISAAFTLVETKNFLAEYFNERF